MRVAILAGLIVGLSLAFQSAHAVHTRVIVVHAASSERARASADFHLVIQ